MIEKLSPDIRLNSRKAMVIISEKPLLSIVPDLHYKFNLWI